jgi:uncharacterized protein (TIGR03083 family)
MGDEADRAIAAMRAMYDRVAGRVAKMDAADLGTQSGASDWTVAQVLSHMGSGAEIMLAAVQGAVAGTGLPDGEFTPGVWARWNEMAPAEQAAGFVESGERIVALFEGFDAKTRAELRIDLGFLPKPVDVATAVGLRLSELAFHTWDIEVAFDPAAALAAEAVEFVFAPMDMFLGFFAKPEEITRTRILTVDVLLTEPRKNFGLSLGDKVSLLAGTPSEVDGVLRAPAEAWLRLLAGRLAPEHTPDSVSLYGGTLTLDDLRRVFPGY